MGTSSSLSGAIKGLNWLAVIVSVVGPWSHARAEQAALPADTDPKIVAAIQQLGDPSYSVREHASHELARLGSQAKSEVTKVLDSRDLEVRYRARLVYAQIVQKEFKQRVAEFVANPTGEASQQLPGWQRFRTLAGNDNIARRLFVEMLQAEPALMESLQRDEKHLPNLGLTMDTRVQQILFWMQNAQMLSPRQPQNLGLGTIAALLFVGSDPDVPVSATTAMQVSNFSYQQEFQSAMGSKERAEPLKRLLGAWVVRDLGNQHSLQAVMMALRFDLKEGIQPSLTLVRGGATPQLRQYAILGLGKLGGKQHIEDLEPLLKDEAVCAAQQVAQNQVVQTRVCDVALAVMVRLTGQQLRDYGFTRVQENTMMLYNVSSLGFAEDAQRQTAITKWREWSKARSESKPAPQSEPALKRG